MAKSVIKYKLKEWFDRYFWIELTSMITAVIGANISFFFTRNIIISAFVGTWSDNIVYYSLMTYREIKTHKEKYGKLTFIGFLKVFRNMITEFGPAEYLDSFVIRPFYLAVIPYIVPNYSIAIFIGSFLANISFYIPVIISYELRKKIFEG